jgi:hypothetical protein
MFMRSLPVTVSDGLTNPSLKGRRSCSIYFMLIRKGHSIYAGLMPLTKYNSQELLVRIAFDTVAKCHEP